MNRINLKDFVKKYGLTDHTMNESDLGVLMKSLVFFQIDPRDSKKFTTQWFVDFDNGERGGTRWTSFWVREAELF